MNTFQGADYDEKIDLKRLSNQINKIKTLMLDGKWRTLGEIEIIVRAPQSSISAQLRNLRKVKHGGYIVNRQKRGDRANGLFEYQLTII